MPSFVDGSIVEALPRIAMASFRDAQSGSGKKLKWTLHILQREAQSSGASCCDRSEATQIEGKAGDGIHRTELRRLPAHRDESAGTSAAWPTRKNCWLIWRNSTRSLSLENLSSDSRGHSSRVASPASRSADNNPLIHLIPSSNFQLRIFLPGGSSLVSVLIKPEKPTVIQFREQVFNDHHFGRLTLMRINLCRCLRTFGKFIECQSITMSHGFGRLPNSAGKIQRSQRRFFPGKHRGNSGRFLDASCE